jgi:RHS repeat-associated protein
MAGISSKAAGKLENKFKYNGKEEQRQEFSDGNGLDWMDYGARMYDAQIGRWHVQDNFSETYYGLTPYNYCANNPVNMIDVDGNLFIFANGFMLNHWQGGTNPTKEYRYKADPGVSYTVSNPNYYNPDRGFYSDGPRNNGKKFENDYWEGVDIAYKNAYKDENSYYTNGSFTPKSSANARFTDGAKAGADLIAKLESGEITLKDGETIKIVGHSQGAAYAAGIASALAKYSKYGALIEFVDYLSPHQPGDINHPSGVKGRQFSTKSDKVSSKGLIPWLFGGSDYEKISGTEWGMQRGSYDGDRGGHSVGTWLNDLIDYWRGLGITVNVIE